MTRNRWQTCGQINRAMTILNEKHYYEAAQAASQGVICFKKLINETFQTFEKLSLGFI